MATVTLLNAVTTAQIGAAQVMPSPPPARCSFNVSISNANTFATATMEGTTDGQNYSPLRGVQIQPGATSQAVAIHFSVGAPYIGWRAVAEKIGPGTAGTTLTATVTY